MTDRRIPRGFWTLWMAVAIDLLGFGIIIPLLPLYAEQFDASPFAIGALFASYSLAQFVFSPVWGRVSDRVGRRPILLVTIAGSALGSLILGLAGSLAVLFVGRIIDGVSGASVAVARASVADIAEPDQRPRLMGLLGAAFGVGFVIGPVIGASAALVGPSVPFLVSAALSAINFAVAWVRLPETQRDEAATAKPRLRDVPSQVRSLVLLTFVAIVAFSAFEATFALLADRRLGLSDSSVALVFAGVGVVLVVTQGGLVGPITERLGEAGTMRLGLGLNVIGFTALALSSAAVLLLPGLAVLAVGQGLLTPTLSSAVAGAVDESTVGVALGVQQSMGGLARVIGPLLGGVLFGIGVGVPYGVTALITATAVLLVPRRSLAGETAGAR